jgi:hypothetical protein
MKVIFKTNIDHYQTNCFPLNLEIPPRIGETVLVTEVFIDYYSKQNLPIRMEVVDVIWLEKFVVCELWYKKIDLDKTNLN